MMENRQAFLTAKQKMEIRPTAVPIPAEDEVLVKIDYVGVCGSDVHFFESGEFNGPLPFPIGLGHESAGTVVQIGAKVKHLQPGDRVALEPGVTCGKCKYCLEGKYNICPDVDFLAAPPNYKGALAAYIAHPAHLAFKLPDNVSTLEGALVEPLAVGFHGAVRGQAGFGKNVVILGSGCIGLMTLLACKYMGAPNIVVADVFDNRLEAAKKMGATAVVNTAGKNAVEAVKEALSGRCADIVFECAGSPATTGLTYRICDRGGKIVMVGNVHGQTPFDFLEINNKEIDVISVFRYRNIYPGIIEAIASGKLDVKPMVSNIFNFENVQEAFESSMNNKQYTVKNVVRL